MAEVERGEDEDVVESEGREAKGARPLRSLSGLGCIVSD